MAELRLFGRSAAPGVAKGVVAVLDAARRPRLKPAGSQAEEALALQRAMSRALAEVETLAEKATGEAADMLGFQVAMLSDEELVEKLNESGYPVARRTVTKYRKMLNIPSSRQRKDWTA